MIRTTLCFLLCWAIGCAAKKEDPTDLMSSDGYAQTECGVCVTGRCQEESEACGEDPGCASFKRCLLACPLEGGEPATGCAATCTEQVNSGFKQMRNLLGCLAGEASLACPCGKPRPASPPILTQMCTPSLPEDANLCNRCENARCCESFAAYKKNCWARCTFLCMQACKGDDKCIYECAQRPRCPKMGEPYYEELGDCTPQPESMRRYAERLACLRFRCPGPPGCTPDKNCGCAPLGACAQCMNDKCRDVTLQQVMDPDCILIGMCAAANQCGADPACNTACDKKHPGCGAKIAAAVYCAQKHCVSACL